MHTLSYYHAMYFPRRFEETYRRGLLLDTGEEVARWQRTLRHYVGKMTELGAGRPLLLKNPGYSAQMGAIRALWPNARFVHIYRNPYVVFESTRRAHSAPFCASWPCRATSMSRSMRWCSRCTPG